MLLVETPTRKRLRSLAAWRTWPSSISCTPDMRARAGTRPEAAEAGLLGLIFTTGPKGEVSSAITVTSSFLIESKVGWEESANIKTLSPLSWGRDSFSTARFNREDLSL